MRRSPRPLSDRVASDPPVHRQMVDAISDALIATDLTGRIIEWNPAATRVYGWTAAEARRGDFRDIVSPALAPTDDALITACIAMGQVWLGRVNVQHRDGTRFLIDGQHSPLRDATGRVNGIVYVSRPVPFPSDVGVPVGDSLVLIRPDGFVPYMSAPMYAMLGLPVGLELLLATLVHPDDQLVLRHVLAGEPDARTEVALRLRDVEKSYQSFRFRINDLTSARPGGILLTGDATVPTVTVDGVTNGRQARRLDAPPSDAVVTNDLGGMVTAWNADAQDLYGWSADDIVGREVTVLSPPERRHELQALLVQAADGAVSRHETWQVTKQGRKMRVSLSVSPVFDGEGTIVGTTIVARDATAQRLQERLGTLDAFTDALTGLPNGTLLTERLQQLLDGLQDVSRKVAVLFIDVDEFEKINASLGHQAGDEVLVTLSRRLRRVLRDDESVGRFAGDEFVVCALVDDQGGAQAIAERIAGVLGARVTVQGHAVNPTVTIGIAITDDAQRKPDTLLREADDAMQHAKVTGRAAVSVAGGPTSALAQPTEPPD